MARVAQINPKLYRAYLLKDQFRLIFQVRGKQAITALDAWYAWARRCRIPSFVEFYYKIVEHRDTIINTLKYGLSNGCASYCTSL